MIASDHSNNAKMNGRPAWWDIEAIEQVYSLLVMLAFVSVADFVGEHGDRKKISQADALVLLCGSIETIENGKAHGEYPARMSNIRVAELRPGLESFQHGGMERFAVG